MIAIPLRSSRPMFAAHIAAIAAAIGRKCKAALRVGQPGNWPFLFVAMSIAADGWFTLGPLAQSTVVAAAVLRRIRGK